MRVFSLPPHLCIGVGVCTFYGYSINMARTKTIKRDIIVVLHNIRSLHNVGSIFRTADAAGVKKIYLCGITPKPVDRLGAERNQFTKVSLGAEKYVEWEYSRRTSDIIKKLRAEKYKIFAVEQSKKSIPYYKSTTMSRGSKIALIFGNEVRGLAPSILKLADKILEIPMQGYMVRHAHHPHNRGGSCGKESLNVAVAFGIVVFRLVYK